MNDTPEMPEMELVPKAIVQLAIPSDAFYVLETPPEVRGKLTDLKNDYSGSLGEDSDDSGLLVLNEIELHTRPEVSPELIERSVHPQLIAWVKDLHLNYWASQLQIAGEANQQWRQMEEHTMAGVPGPVRTLIEGLTGGGASFSEPGGEGMTAVEFAKKGAEEIECCCGHKAMQHEIGDKIGACEQCGCARFHTH
jgi:hypothetical protein